MTTNISSLLKFVSLIVITQQALERVLMPKCSEESEKRPLISRFGSFSRTLEPGSLSGERLLSEESE